MSPLSNYMEVLKLLPLTNCRDCGLATCLAFAVNVIQGKKPLASCPHLAPGLAAATQVQPDNQIRMEADLAQMEDDLRQKVSQVDFAEAAPRLGARLIDGGLAIPMLGNEFLVDPSGLVTSRCHVIPWVHIPLLTYILTCQGKEPTGRWLPLRDLPGGMDWGQFFKHRCETTLKKIIDNYSDLFKIMFEVFVAQPAKAFDADIAVVLRPLPKVPLLLCYWKAEEGMDSALHLFWDSTAPDNVHIDSLYYLGVGMVNMFENIAQTHGK